MTNERSDRSHSRRAFITSLAAGLVACGCGGGGGDSGTNSGGGVTPPATGGSGRLKALGYGCYSPAMAGYSADSIGCGIGSTFGDPWFDQRFNQELFTQASFFSGFTPTVYVLDECSPQYANALSDPRGIILFGRWLATKTIVETRSELPIAGILAHEWAHQLQFRFGWMQQTEPTVRRTELEADMWSGLYMGMAKLWAGPQMNAYFQTLFNLGDYNFNNPNHHGTPNQRLAAGATGLNVAQQLLRTGQRLGYDQLHAIFLQEVTRITSTIGSTPGSSSKPALDTAGLSYPANLIAEALDQEWISGVASGRRSLAELERMPEVPESLRQNLYPY